MKHIVFVIILTTLTSQLAWGMGEAPLQFVYSDDADGRTHEPSKLYTERKHSGKVLHEREVTTIEPNTYFIKCYQAGHYETQQVADARDHTLSITNLTTKKTSWLHDATDRTLSHQDHSCVAFNADGSLVATGYQNRYSWGGSTERSLVVVWNIAHERIEAQDHPLQNVDNINGVRTLAFNPIKTEIAIGRTSGTIDVWNYKTNRRFTISGCHAKAVLALAYNRLQQLASSSSDLTIKIWDAEKYENTQTIQLDKAHDIIGFYPDSSTLFSFESYETDKISFHKINS